MPKSLGNGIDPMDVTENIGADAFKLVPSNGSAPARCALSPRNMLELH